MDSNNITFRKYKSKAISVEDLTNSSLFDSSMHSLPGNTDCDEIDCTELYNKLEKISSELQSATQEIDNLNAENQELRNELNKCKRIIETYKTIQFIETPTSNKKRKGCNLVMKERRKVDCTHRRETKNTETQCEDSQRNIEENKESLDKQSDTIQVVYEDNNILEELPGEFSADKLTSEAQDRVTKSSICSIKLSFPSRITPISQAEEDSVKA
ncbi:hypothetical protein ACJJTC_000146 [Scirpophaga incertulas]